MRKILRFLWDECVDLAEFIGKLYMFFCGDMALLAGAAYGLCLIGMSTGSEVCDMRLSGLWEQFFGAILGVFLMTGCCGSLTLKYGKRIFGLFRFRLQAAVRIAFLFVGPLAAAVNYSWLMNEIGVWTLVVFPCLTIIPFGLSLRGLILKRRKSQA